MSNREFRWGAPSSGGLIPSPAPGQRAITIDFVVPAGGGLHPSYRCNGGATAEIADRLFATLGPLWKMLSDAPPREAVWARVSFELFGQEAGWRPALRAEEPAPLFSVTLPGMMAVDLTVLANGYLTRLHPQDAAMGTSSLTAESRADAVSYFISTLKSWVGSERFREHLMAAIEREAGEERVEREEQDESAGSSAPPLRGHELVREAGEPSFLGTCERCGRTNVEAGGVCSADKVVERAKEKKAKRAQ